MVRRGVTICQGCRRPCRCRSVRYARADSLTCAKSGANSPIGYSPLVRIASQFADSAYRLDATFAS
jgi:hypothetical protein